MTRRRLGPTVNNRCDLLLRTNNDSIQSLVQERTVALERDMLEEEARRRSNFDAQRENLTVQIRTVENQLQKLHDLTKHVEVIENIQRDVLAVINNVTRILVDELNLQRDRNENFSVDTDTIAKRTLRALQSLAHERTGNSRLSEFTRAYLAQISYPRIVNAMNLRDTFEKICSFNCEQMLRRVNGNDDENDARKDISGYTIANNVRDALVACLYFYGISDSFLTTIERWYTHMNESSSRAKRRFTKVGIDPDSYHSAFVREIYNGTNRDRFFPDRDCSERQCRGQKLFYNLHLDLRVIRTELFGFIILIFRNRAITYERSAVEPSSFSTTTRKDNNDSISTNNTVWRIVKSV